MLEEGQWEATLESVMAPLLPFYREMVQELVEQDGLCVMSAGLGWQKARHLQQYAALLCLSIGKPK